MTITSVDSKIGKADINWYDGVSKTFTRLTSAGGSLTCYRVGNTVDVLSAYGSNTAYTNTTLSTAISNIGSSSATFDLAPGTWTISADLTIPSNVSLNIPAGAVLSVASGKTLTIDCTVIAGDYTIFSGSGTVTWSNGQAFRASWVGVVADGVTECKTELALAASIAAAAGVDLVLPSGTILCTPTTAISLAGIPEVRTDGGETTIDCSSVTIGPVFTCYGTRTAIATAQTIASGAVALTVSAGTYPQGTQILIGSDESLPNTNREGDATPTYYCKGGRHFVQDYSAPTLTVGPPMEYAYTNAYVYKLTETRIKIGRKITFLGNTGAEIKGLTVRYAYAEISATFKYFRDGCVIFQDSRGRFDGEVVNHYAASDLGYGVCVHDLSNVSIVGAQIRNCRHCVTGGSSGFWNKTDFGGADAAVGLPGRYTVSGGFYENVDSYNAAATSLALECHGNMASMVVTGATIRGGLGLNAHSTVIDGNFISFRERYAVHFATDCNSTSWGDLAVTSNTIKIDGAAISGTSANALVIDSGNKCRSIMLLSNNIIKTDNTNDATLANLVGQVGSLRISNNEIVASQGTGAALAIYFLIHQYGYLKFSNNTLSYCGLSVTPKTAAVNADIHNNHVYLSGVNGIYVASDATGYYTILNLTNNTAYKNQRHGIYLTAKALALDLSGCRCRNNNQAAGSYDGINAALDDACVSVTARNVVAEDTQAVPTQRYGLYAAGGASCVANLYINGLSSDGCTAGHLISAANAVKRERIGLRSDAGTHYPDGLLDAAGVLWRVKTDGTLEAFS